MKFWKILNSLIEQTLPDWRDMFLSYKDLKKQLKLICPKDSQIPPCKRARLDGDGFCQHVSEGEAELTKEVDDFLKLLEVEIEKFNAFFVEKEEEYVIKWKELQDRVERAKDSNVELMTVGREIVDFHGEMVLLENYSALNYTVSTYPSRSLGVPLGQSFVFILFGAIWFRRLLRGFIIGKMPISVWGLVKIIKKYDKRTGGLVRLPFIQEVLNQPFFKIDVLNKLVKECEITLSKIFPKNAPSSSTLSIDEEGGCGGSLDENEENKETLVKVPKELAEIEHMENMYTKLTLSALHTLEEIRGGSSTVSMFSLPSLRKNDLDVDWEKITALDQAAK